MTIATRNPIRVLHVVGGMDRGGTETWLMHVLRHVDRARLRMDFLTHTREKKAYDDEIRALGSKILCCPRPNRPLQYARSFKNILREHGPYDVVHSHVHHFSGWVLRAAHQAGIPIRIAHSHSDTSSNDHRSSWMRRGYLQLTQHLIANHATAGLAASGKAAAALFGKAWQSDPRWRVLYCGIDLEPFRVHVNRQAVRAELGIPPSAFVVGHVGRFVEPKNHSFLVEIARHVVAREKNAYFLLVGDGPLRPAIEAQVRDAGLSDRILFAGSRSDVHRLMLGGMDVFLLPSLHEGLPLVLMESQAAGLPCLLSDAVSPEADVVPFLRHRCDLSLPPSHWAQLVLRIVAHVPTTLQRKEALQIIMESSFNIKNAVPALEAFYSESGCLRAVA